MNGEQRLPTGAEVLAGSQRVAAIQSTFTDAVVQEDAHDDVRRDEAVGVIEGNRIEGSTRGGYGSKQALFVNFLASNYSFAVHGELGEKQC